jgi:hypothetical protein
LPISDFQLAAVLAKDSPVDLLISLICLSSISIALTVVNSLMGYVGCLFQRENGFGIGDGGTTWGNRVLGQKPRASWNAEWLCGPVRVHGLWQHQAEYGY